MEDALTMPSGLPTKLQINLNLEERRTLKSWQRATTISAGLFRRARIIILLAEGNTITDVAWAMGVKRSNVYKWAERFKNNGVAGLHDERVVRWSPS